MFTITHLVSFSNYRLNGAISLFIERAVKEVSALVDAVHAGKRHLDNSDIKRNGASVAQRAKRSE